MEWVLNYADPSNPIGVLKSHHKGMLTRKGIIGKKATTLDPHLFHCAHFHVLQQMSIVFDYLDEHNPEHNESWLAKEHMRKFTRWLRD
jgi:hypothetical protein